MLDSRIVSHEEYERVKYLLNSMKEVNERHKDYLYVLQLREIIEQYELAHNKKETDK